MSDGVSFLHINIRSINKNFKNFKLFLSSLGFTFSVTCFSEPWLDETTISKKSLNELPKYASIQLVRKQKGGGGVALCIHQSTEFKMRNDLSINSDDVGSISMKILFENGKNTIFNVLYRQPKGQIELFEKLLKETFSWIKNSNKQVYVAGDVNHKVLDYERCKKVQEVLNIIYENSMIPIINKPTKVTNKTVTAIDHILTKSHTETILKTAILKCDVSDNFPICHIIPSLKFLLKNEIVNTYKKSFNESSVFNFKKKIFQIDWQEIEILQNSLDAYTYF